MADSRGRVAPDPQPPVREAVERIHALTGRKRTTIYADMLDAVAPAFAEQVELIQRIQSNPDRAAEMVREFGVQGSTRSVSNCLTCHRHASEGGRARMPPPETKPPASWRWRGGRIEQLRQEAQSVWYCTQGHQCPVGHHYRRRAAEHRHQQACPRPRLRQRTLVPRLLHHRPAQAIGRLLLPENLDLRTVRDLAR